MRLFLNRIYVIHGRIGIYINNASNPSNINGDPSLLRIQGENSFISNKCEKFMYLTECVTYSY